MAEANTTSIPEKGQPASGTAPKYTQKFNDLSGDEALIADNLWPWVKKCVARYKQQPARQQFTQTGGTMDTCDRMYRVALRRKTDSKQYQATDSDVASPMFFNLARTLAASWNAIFLHGKDLPAEFEPEIDSDEYRPGDGKEIADQQNMLEVHVFDEDKRRAKIRETLDYLSKYGHEMLTDEWVLIRDERTERVPKAFDKAGVPIWFKFEKKTRTIYEGPVLIRHDLKDCYFDAEIPDMQKQNCIVTVSQKPYSDLLAEQASGWMWNVDKVGTDGLYSGEDADNPVLKERRASAGEEGEPDATWLCNVIDVWCQAPIKEGKKRNGKGKWSPDDTVPGTYWATFVGKLDGGAVCVRCIKNPYNHGRLPHMLVKTHRDDKGAYGMCLGTQIEPMYWEDVTNTNLAIDNVRKRTNTPYTADGPIHRRNLTFRAGGNDIIQIAKGTLLAPLSVTAATEITLGLRDKIRDDAERTAGVTKALMPEALGGRTSASEAVQVRDQALMPIDAQAEFIAGQLFPWLFEMDAFLYRQFADPDRTITVTHNNMIKPVQPAHLWGPIKIRVTAVERFRNDTRRRQELNSLLQGVWPAISKDATAEGRIKFARWMLKEFGHPKPWEIFPGRTETDARRVALAENEYMITRGLYDPPDKNENHEVHLALHKQARLEYSLLPEKQQNPKVLSVMDAHIQAQEDLAQTEQGEGMTAPQPEGLPGQLAGNPMEAQAGTMANM